MSYVFYPVQGSCVRSADCKSKGSPWLSPLPTVGPSSTTRWRTYDLCWNKQQQETSITSDKQLFHSNWALWNMYHACRTSCHSQSGTFYWHWHPIGRWNYILQLSLPKCPHLYPSPFPHSDWGEQEKEKDLADLFNSEWAEDKNWVSILVFKLPRQVKFSPLVSMSIKYFHWVVLSVWLEMSPTI